MTGVDVTLDGVALQAEGVVDRSEALLLDIAVRVERSREARRIVDIEERPPPPEPKVVTLTERLAVPLPPLRWRVRDFQPEHSRTLLAAQYKAGKTTLLANLARSLVDGDPFLGLHEVRPVDGTVALLDFEMSERQLLTWLADQAIRNTDRILPVSLRGSAGAFDLRDPERLSWWVDVLRRHQVRYIVWDCIRPVLDALGLDEHREAGPLLVAFDTLLARADVPEACAAHHMGHANERSRGDSRFRDWPDSEWRLVREDDTPTSARYVTAFGRDVDVAESHLTFDARSRRLSVSGGSRRSMAADRAGVDILAWLHEQDGGRSQRAIERAMDDTTDHGRKAVREAIARLFTAGRLTRDVGPNNAHLYAPAAGWWEQ